MVAMATVELRRYIRHSYVMVRHVKMKLCLFYSETPYLYLLLIHLWGLKPTMKKLVGLQIEIFNGGHLENMQINHVPWVI